VVNFLPETPPVWWAEAIKGKEDLFWEAYKPLNTWHKEITKAFEWHAEDGGHLEEKGEGMTYLTLTLKTNPTTTKKTVDFGKEMVYIRNISIKMQHGCTYSMQAKLLTLLLNGCNAPRWPFDENQPWRILDMSRSTGNDPQQDSLTPSPEEEGCESQLEADGTPFVPNTLVDRNSYTAASTIAMKIDQVLPGTRRLDALPSWLAQVSDQRLRMIHAQAFGLPNPGESTIKISFAKFKRAGLSGNGYQVRYLFQQMSSPPIILQQSQGLREVASSLFGPLEMEVDEFLNTMSKPLFKIEPAFVLVLDQLRARGALAEEIDACNQQYNAITGRGHSKADLVKGANKGGVKRKASADERNSGKGGKASKGKSVRPKGTATWRPWSGTSSSASSSFFSFSVLVWFLFVCSLFFFVCLLFCLSCFRSLFLF
jgi:hypothetical protein